MKILHVIPSVSPKRGGPSFTVRNMAEGLAARGINVEIATTDDDEVGRLPNAPLNGVRLENGVPVRYFRKQSEFYLFSWPLTQWLATHARDYDVLHLHALFSYPVMPAAFFAHQAKRPYILRPLGVLNRYGMENRRPLLKQLSFSLLDSYILRHATRVHYTAEDERQQAAILGVPHRSIVIPLGIDLSPFTESTKDNWLANHTPHFIGRQIILFLSRIDPKKGLDLLIPAFAELRQMRDNVGLVIAGDGSPDYITTLQQMASDLGVTEDIYWAGFVAGREKCAVYRAADLFVLPSYSENFGVVVVEALASGLPVILSNQVGIYREVESAQAGWVVPCEIDPLAKALTDALDSPPLLVEYSQNALALAKAKFSQTSMIDSLIALYEETLNAR